MMAPLNARAIENGAIGRVLVDDLAFEDATVFKSEMEDVAVRRIRHWIESHDSHRTVDVVEAVPNAAHVAMTTMETPHSVERLALRQFRHI
jgi:hypothetical protein